MYCTSHTNYCTAIRTPVYDYSISSSSSSPRHLIFENTMTTADGGGLVVRIAPATTAGEMQEAPKKKKKAEAATETLAVPKQHQQQTPIAKPPAGQKSRCRPISMSISNRYLRLCGAHISFASFGF